MTNELDSEANEDSCEDNPVLIRFNKEEPMINDFTCMVEMEFSSLKKFNKAILEYTVLNGREVRFSKNDNMRCRVVCKHTKLCNYIIL